MWALVESNNITKLIPNPKPMVIGDVQYPSNIFTSWSSAELKAIGLYEISVDESNLKDNRYYVNGDISYTFASDAVTGAYPSAVAKPLDDVLWLDSDDKPDGVSTGDLRTEGLKNIYKKQINNEASVLLSEYDWYTLRAADGGTAVPSNVSTYRAAIRTKSNAMCTQIDNAADVDALAALFEYTGDPLTRPLGEWPTIGS
tara:strand:+ start:1163 stop:1762 length:600 start_codon:yes stop_codon:yes gene_type:complete